MNKNWMVHMFYQKNSGLHPSREAKNRPKAGWNRHFAAHFFATLELIDMKYIAIVILFYVSSYSSYVLSCSCMENSTDLNLAYDKADTVALIRVCEAHLESRSYEASSLNSETGEWEKVYVTEDVVVGSGYPEEIFKGNTGKVVIKAGNPDSMCHTTISVGQTYLAFVDLEGVAYLNVCSPTKGLYHKKVSEFVKQLTQNGSHKLSKRDAVSCIPY
jgi:hypothetical protein